MRDPFTSLPEPLTIGSDYSKRPIPGQLSFPIFRGPEDKSHAKGCCCVDCKARIAKMYGRTA